MKSENLTMPQVKKVILPQSDREKELQDKIDQLTKLYQEQDRTIEKLLCYRHFLSDVEEIYPLCRYFAKYEACFNKVIKPLLKFDNPIWENTPLDTLLKVDNDENYVEKYRDHCSLYTKLAFGARIDGQYQHASLFFKKAKYSSRELFDDLHPKTTYGHVSVMLYYFEEINIKQAFVYSTIVLDSCSNLIKKSALPLEQISRIKAIALIVNNACVQKV